MTSIFRSIEEARGHFGPCALTIGNFDGVHIGHQALISATVASALENNLVPAVLTFDPHPSVIVAPERAPQMISTLEDRLRLLGLAGAQRVLVLPFTAEVARLSPQEFVSQVLVDALETKIVFVGENFRFGHKQSGHPETLRNLGVEYGFVSHFLKPVAFRGEIVSSSLVRQYLANGRVSRAARLLARCFSVEGPVVSGRGIGRSQAVPTLNLRPTPGQVLPRGIYITETLEHSTTRRWQSVTSVGTNPTFGETGTTIETFLLAPPLDEQTPRRIEVRFRRFIRPERRFSTSAALKEQIANDVSQARIYWRRLSRLSSFVP